MGDILVAAIRVLGREGASRFTTARVAEEAGVSVGSLYQYFPNKEALLFRLQADEWEQTWGALSAILEDSRVPWRERLDRAVVAFFVSEGAEAALRSALEEAGAAYRESPEAAALAERARQTMLVFVGEALPGATEEQKAFAADFVFTSMAAVAEKVTAEGRPAEEVKRWGAAFAELLRGYLSTPSSAPVDAGS